MTKVIAVDISLGFIEALDSIDAAIARCPGLEIAEGDWLFFDGDGQPLEADFLEKPLINPEKGSYSDGVYTLRPGGGKTFQQWLFDRCREKDFWFGTLRDLERHLT